MTNDEYEQFVLSKMSMKALEDPLLNAALGLVGESGKIADMVKKYMFHDHHILAEERIMEELGDVLFYVTMMMYAINVDFERVIEMNVDKLNGRYPFGFDSDRSMNRS